jgi:hypothetical protein
VYFRPSPSASFSICPKNISLISVGSPKISLGFLSAHPEVSLGSPARVLWYGPIKDKRKTSLEKLRASSQEPRKWGGIASLKRGENKMKNHSAQNPGLSGATAEKFAI